jgi:hypothetical protein
MIVDRQSPISNLQKGFVILLSALAVGLLAGCDCSQQAVTIRWTTESEFNTAGFNLYRSANEDGPFTAKVNDRLIPARDDPALGGEYVYTDTQVVAGGTYYYQLEEVEKTGNLKKLRTTKVEVGRCGLP